MSALPMEAVQDGGPSQLNVSQPASNDFPRQVNSVNSMTSVNSNYNMSSMDPNSLQKGANSGSMPFQGVKEYGTAPADVPSGSSADFAHQQSYFNNSYGQANRPGYSNGQKVPGMGQALQSNFSSTGSMFPISGPTIQQQVGPTPTLNQLLTQSGSGKPDSNETSSPHKQGQKSQSTFEGQNWSTVPSMYQQSGPGVNQMAHNQSPNFDQRRMQHQLPGYLGQQQQPMPQQQQQQQSQGPPHPGAPGGAMPSQESHYPSHGGPGAAPPMQSPMYRPRYPQQPQMGTNSPFPGGAPNHPGSYPHSQAFMAPNQQPGSDGLTGGGSGGVGSTGPGAAGSTGASHQSMAPPPQQQPSRVTVPVSPSGSSGSRSNTPASASASENSMPPPRLPGQQADPSAGGGQSQEMNSTGAGSGASGQMPPPSPQLYGRGPPTHPQQMQGAGMGPQGANPYNPMYRQTAPLQHMSSFPPNQALPTSSQMFPGMSPKGPVAGPGGLAGPPYGPGYANGTVPTHGQPTGPAYHVPMGGGTPQGAQPPVDPSSAGGPGKGAHIAAQAAVMAAVNQRRDQAAGNQSKTQPNISGSLTPSVSEGLSASTTGGDSTNSAPSTPAPASAGPSRKRSRQTSRPATPAGGGSAGGTPGPSAGQPPQGDAMTPSSAGVGSVGDRSAMGSPAWPGTPPTRPAGNMLGGPGPMGPGGAAVTPSSSTGSVVISDVLAKQLDLGEEPERRAMLERLSAFMEERGAPILSIPNIGKQPVDLFKFYSAVRDRGGFEQVCRKKLWKEVGSVIMVGASSNAAYTLKKSYIRCLLPYECKFDKGGVDPQAVLKAADPKKEKSTAAAAAANSNRFSASPSSGGPSATPHDPSTGMWAQQGPGAAPHMGPSPHPGQMGGPAHPGMGGGMPMGHHPHPGQIGGPGGGHPGIGAPMNHHMGGPMNHQQGMGVGGQPGHPHQHPGMMGMGPAGMGLNHHPHMGGAMQGQHTQQGQPGMMGPGGMGKPGGVDMGSAGPGMMGAQMGPGAGPMGMGGPGGQMGPSGGAQMMNGMPPQQQQQPGGPQSHMSYPQQQQQHQGPHAMDDQAMTLQQPQHPAMGPYSQQLPQGAPFNKQRFPGPHMGPSQPGQPPQHMGHMQPGQQQSPMPEDRRMGMMGPQQGAPARVPHGSAMPPMGHMQGGGNNMRPPGPMQSAPCEGRMTPGAMGMTPSTMQSSMGGMGSAGGVHPTNGPGVGPQGQSYPGQQPGVGPQGRIMSHYKDSLSQPLVSSRTRSPAPQPQQGAPSQATSQPSVQVSTPSTTENFRPPPAKRPHRSKAQIAAQQAAQAAAAAQQLQNQERLGNSPGPWNSNMGTPGRKGSRPMPPSYVKTAMQSAGGDVRLSPALPSPFNQRPPKPLPIPKAHEFPAGCIEAVQAPVIKRKAISSKQMGGVDIWRVMMSLQSGLLGECTWALDVLNVLLHDDQSVLYLCLDSLPGLLNQLLMHYKKDLKLLFPNELTEMSDLDCGSKLVSSSASDDLKESSSAETSLPNGHPANTTQPATQIIQMGPSYTWSTRHGKKVVAVERPVPMELKDQTSLILSYAQGVRQPLRKDLGSGQSSASSSSEATGKPAEGKPERAAATFKRHIVATFEGTDSVQSGYDHFFGQAKKARYHDYMRSSRATIVSGRQSPTVPGKLPAAGEAGKASDTDNSGSKKDRTGQESQDLESSNGKKLSSESEGTPPVAETKTNATASETDVVMEEAKPASKASPEQEQQPSAAETEEPQSAAASTPSVEKTKKASTSKPQSEKDLSREAVVERLSKQRLAQRRELLADRIESWPGADDAACDLFTTVSDRQEDLVSRCLVLSNIIRSLSFVPPNERRMASNASLLRVLGLLLTLHTKTPLIHPPVADTVGNSAGTPAAGNDDEESFFAGDSGSGDAKASDELGRLADCDALRHSLAILREDALVTLANLACQLNLVSYGEPVIRPVLEGLLFWGTTPSAYARDPSPASGSLSFHRLAIEALSKLCAHPGNIDLLLATPGSDPSPALPRLYRVAVDLLGDGRPVDMHAVGHPSAGAYSRGRYRPAEPVLQEFSIVLIAGLVMADSGAARGVAISGPCISRLLSFLERAESNALAVAQRDGISALRDNPETMGTSLDMIRRTAAVLCVMADVPENAPLFKAEEDRLLNLVMSQILDQHVARMLSDALYVVSTGNGPTGIGRMQHSSL